MDQIVSRAGSRPDGLVESRLRIAAPLAEVWAVTLDVARWPEWCPTISAVACSGPLAPGHRFVLKQPLQRARIWQVTELVLHHRVSWATVDGGPAFVACHHMALRGGQVETRLCLRFERAGWGLTWVQAGAFHWALARENRALKRVCEGGSWGRGRRDPVFGGARG